MARLPLAAAASASADDEQVKNRRRRRRIEEPSGGGTGHPDVFRGDDGSNRGSRGSAAGMSIPFSGLVRSGAASRSRSAAVAVVAAAAAAAASCLLLIVVTVLAAVVGRAAIPDAVGGGIGAAASDLWLHLLLPAKREKPYQLYLQRKGAMMLHDGLNGGADDDEDDDDSGNQKLSDHRDDEEESQSPPAPEVVPVEDPYITLWLHQVHAWFGPDGEDRYKRIRAFLEEAKSTGFTAVMTDIPWSWTEREGRGDVNLMSFNKDWMRIACDLGLKLHVVLNMREFPPWIRREDHPDYFERAGQTCGKAAGPELDSPSPAHPEVWQMLTTFTGNATSLLLERYGGDGCLSTVSPTINNEFETRYSQTHQAMRDYSSASVENYRKWRRREMEMEEIRRQRRDEEAGDLPPPPDTASLEPPVFPCGVICDPILDPDELMWLGYREEFLAGRYLELCRVVKSRGVETLLHVGEMMATADHLNSNLFFRLAASDDVDHLVMDSNMMLSGAPASPSVVGLMVSAALTHSGADSGNKKAKRKRVHYEVATERILSCSDDGQIVQSRDRSSGAELLFRTGVLHALEAGVHSIGVTNLCAPKMLKTLLPKAMTNDQATTSASTGNGVFCEKRPIECWHESFASISNFVDDASSPQPPGTCPVDLAQHAVLQVFDDLHSRHAHVAVVGEASLLQSSQALSEKVTERKFVRFPCVLQNDRWHIYNGQQEKRLFEAHNAIHPFDEVLAGDIC